MPLDEHLCFPTFSNQDGTVDLVMDMEYLGSDTHTSHQVYMQLGSECLCTLWSLSTELATSKIQLYILRMRPLAKAAHNA